MKKSKKKKFLFILLIVIAVITVGFALLSAQIGISGVSKIKNNRWDIHWDDKSINVTTGSVTAITPAHVSDAENKIVEFAVDFDLPGDFYEFTIDAVNEGTIDGTILDIVKGIYEEDGVTTKTLPEYLEYTVTYADDTTPAADDILEAGSTKKYKVRLTYKANSTTSLEDEDITTYKVQINYQQTTD